MTLTKNERYTIRKVRTKGRILGKSNRPRISIYRSNRYIYAQVIDDDKSRTLVSASNLTPDLKTALQGKPKIEQAKMIGEHLAKLAKTAGITEVVFDRSGHKYHGRIKALADAARAGGLKF